MNSKRLSIDLVLVVALALLTSMLALRGEDGPMRVLLGLLYILFMPGYAVVSALFPSRGDVHPSGDQADSSNYRESITKFERLVLSIGISVGLIPFVGLILTSSGWDIHLVSLSISVSSIVIVASVVAFARRLHAGSRGGSPGWVASLIRIIGSDPSSAGSAKHTVLNVLLVASVLLAGTAFVYSIAFPQNEEYYTELYILSENNNETLVMQNYSSNFRNNSQGSVHIGVSNKEREEKNYTVVAKIQSIQNNDQGLRVISEKTVQTVSVPVDVGETQVRELTFRSRLEGDEFRLVILLYQQTPPPDPSVESSYRSTHVFISSDGADRRPERAVEAPFNIEGEHE